MSEETRKINERLDKLQESIEELTKDNDKYVDCLKAVHSLSDMNVCNAVLAFRFSNKGSWFYKFKRNVSDWESIKNFIILG